MRSNLPVAGSRATRAMLALWLLGGCAASEDVSTLTGGDAERGKAALRAYGCTACHTIPGVPGANGLVGPPLGGIASRAYIGGVAPNTPDNMVRWLMDPPALAPRTAMPNLGVGTSDARDMAAYLYTLR
jgi:cytochrome c